MSCSFPKLCAEKKSQKTQRMFSGTLVMPRTSTHYITKKQFNWFKLKFQIHKLFSSGSELSSSRTSKGSSPSGAKTPNKTKYSAGFTRKSVGNFTPRLPFPTYWLAEWGTPRRNYRTWNTFIGSYKVWKTRTISLTSRRLRNEKIDWIYGIK